MRQRVETITPARAAKLMEGNTSNRPLSKATVNAYADAMRRGEWLITHQGVALTTDGVILDGQHRLAAIIEADTAVDVLVVRDADPNTFEVLDTGKKRNAADALAIEGEKNTHQLASMLRTVFLFDNRPNSAWSGGAAAVTNHQILQTLAENPSIRDYVAVGEQLASATGMIKSAGGAASYLVARPNKSARLQPWLDGLIEGAGLAKGDARLRLRNHLQQLARRQAGETRRRSDTREQVALYLSAFQAWALDEPVSRLRYTGSDPMPEIPVIKKR